jgi:hypothetical protein
MWLNYAVPCLEREDKALGRWFTEFVASDTDEYGFSHWFIIYK